MYFDIRFQVGSYVDLGSGASKLQIPVRCMTD